VKGVLVVDDRLPVPTLDAELRRLVPLLAAAGAQRIILYGSCATRTCRPNSDLDLLVVVPEDGLSLPQRLGRLYARLSPAVPCDLLAYTPAELDLLRGTPLVEAAMRSGRTVYASEESAGT
jgi:predicted nucleotidyltransferase